ncbi:MAG: glycoside hydrolase family 19 protein [Acidimicrobiales bacterium]
MTPFQLKQAMPYCDFATAGAYVDFLTAAMQLYQINTPKRIAAFLGNVATETESLHCMKEKSDGALYEGRMGNTQPGDGARFIGRGLLQITGRYMYSLCGKALHLELLDQPQMLEQPRFACQSGAWFFSMHGCNGLADIDKFGSIVHLINGGYNDLDERIQCWLAARKSLGL